MKILTCFLLIVTITISSLKAQTTLNLKFFIQGYYLKAGKMRPVLYNELVDPNPLSNQVDTALVTLVDTVNPCPAVATFKGIVMTDGTMTCTFPSSVSGHSYYIIVSHRNTVPVASAKPVAFTANTNYDFSTSYNQAWGSDEELMEPGVFAIINGNFNHDQNIDLIDFPFLDVAINTALYGYYREDVNGDGNADILDFPVFDLNINRGTFGPRHFCQ